MNNLNNIIKKCKYSIVFIPYLLIKKTINKIMGIIWLVPLLTTYCTSTSSNCKIDDSQKGTFWDITLPIDQRINDLVSRLTLEEKVKQLMFNAPEIERLGIPEYNWWNESLHGIARNGRATVFPQAISLAATFDDQLIYRISSAISDEARAKFNASIAIENRDRYTGLTFWAPNGNIFRDPRWGRGQETFGEDPYLTIRMGIAYVKGLQGNNSKYLKAAACAKHFVIHSGPEALRHEFNAIPLIKDFVETYTPAFEALIREAKVEGVMCAYNRTYDQPCCGSQYLLIDLLRNKWGFNGYITSDCWALVDFYEGHKVVISPVEAATMALKAGVDLNCGNVYYPFLIDALAQGLVTEKEIDDRLKNLLQTRFKLGLFDPPTCNPYNQIGIDIINCEKHKKLALEAAEKSIVLLKNSNNVLPLRKDLRYLYVFGPNATNSEVLVGNYYEQSSEMSPILAGITAKIHPGTKLQYRMAFLPDKEKINPNDCVLNDCAKTDATICIMGLSVMLEGEEGESLLSATKGDRIEYNLPKNQIDYLKKLRNALKNKPLIVVITAGCPINMVEIDSLADAILYAWYPGEQGAYAIGNIIFGDISPSGRLPITFPKSIKELPAYDNYSMESRTYKYMKNEPMYPFGFGLSYAQFSYDNINTNKINYSKQDTIIVTGKLKNKSQIEAEEVAQLYVSVPPTHFRTPRFDLKQFQRSQLKANQSTILTFKMPVVNLSTVNEKGEKILLKGNYTIYIGGSAPFKHSIELGANQWVEKNITIN